MDNKVASNKINNISTKMLISRMIQTRRSLTYNNSNRYTVYKKILEANIDVNKKLLLTLGKDIYQRYLRKITKSNSHDIEVRNNLELMYQDIILNLSINEQKQLGIYIETDIEIFENENTRKQNLLLNPEFIYTCKVIHIGAYFNLSITNYKITDVLVPGKKYLFDLQHTSNLGFRLSFSFKQYDFRPLEGLEYVGVPGTKGAYLVYTPPVDTTVYKIYLFNELDKSVLSYDLFGYLIKFLNIEVDYKNKSNFSGYDYLSEATNIIDCLDNYTEIKMDENFGPKFYFQKTDSQFLFTNNNINRRYVLNRQYGLYYGTYYTKINTSTNPIAFLNKGKENFFSVSGNKYDTYYLSNLTKDGELDGSYNFFYDEIEITITGDFGTVGMFSHFYGFNRMEKLLIFADNCLTFSGSKKNYEDKVIQNIECLYPISLMNIEKINNIPFITFNNNYENISYDQNKIYGLCNGQYIIRNIPLTNPIAVINKGKENYITYTGLQEYSLKRMGPDNKNYTYYYEAIIIRVYGDFGKVSVFDYYNGYAGGKHLFQYTDVCDYNIEWDQDREYLTNPSNTQINEFIPLTNYGVHDLDSYIPFSIKSKSRGENYIMLTEDTPLNDDETKYGITVGTYVIMNVPESYPITFLNKGVENLFYYDGFFPYKIRSTGPDGELYDFFYGNINIYVTGNFGTISFYTLNNGFLNGRRKIIFDSFANTGYAIPSYDITNNFPLLNLSDDTNISRKSFNISITEFEKKLPYSNNLTYFRLDGEDRNGNINSQENMPSLTFFTGDTVFFNFQYNNFSNTLGIYEYKDLITNEELIVNNNNNTKLTIKWTPTIPSETYYYYRSSYDPNLIYNTINIIMNNNINIDPSFNSITPSSGSFIDPQINKFIIKFNEAVYTNKGKNIYIKDNNDNIVYTYSSNNLVQADSKTYILNTGFTTNNRLEFTKNYKLILEDDIFYNIYFKSFKVNELAIYTTIESHFPSLLSIYPESNNTDQTIESSDSVIFTFDEQVVTTGNIVILDVSNSITLTPNVEISGNNVLLSNNNLGFELEYKILVNTFNFTDLSNIAVSDINGLMSNYTFYTMSDQRPFINSIVPDYFENDVITSNIVLTFNKSIYLEDSRIIFIKDMTNGVFQQIINTSSSEDLSNNININDNILTITPNDFFSSNVQYSLIISNDVIKDSDGRFFEGFIDDSFYNFTIA